MNDPEKVVLRPTGLYPKLAAAIEEVDRLAKDGTNDHFHYDYTTAEEVYRVIRGPLLSRGLVVIPSIVGASNDGESTILNLHLRVVDSESGEEFEADWLGEGQDKGDKGPYKAATGGMKTWLRHLFLLPADDDPEADATTDKAAEQRPARVKGSTAGKRRAPSQKQLGLLERLLSEKGLTKSEAQTCTSYASANFTGGKDGQASATIEALMNGEDPGKVAAKLLEKAEEWQSKQTDTPADTTGLEGEPDTEGTPF